ncbi:peptidase M23B [Caballeronia calidae]|uniref:Peptidase M23B n=1 Tax=Caballeronia calidae TaxID=1777139 RepID=A0A158DFW1_9BURK|nr:peptidoglycan DD-metalloendopeptidase family protein [Caballeronia calidae]SAK93435.1 peptidase M23B [Caballeronia calidae]
MPFSPITASPGKAGRLFFACAIGSVCTVVICNALQRPHSSSAVKDDAPAVSFRQTAVPSAAPASAPPAAPPEPARMTESATVDGTFSDAAQSLGLDSSTIATLTQAFAAKVDLRRDLRKGDTLSVIYDRPQGGATPHDEPLAARLTTGSSSHDVFLYRDAEGEARYYSKDGDSTKPAFTRYPVEFTRVSSDFSLRRLDPVTHRWQSHDGVDLAAPIGTPVRATAQGTVTFIGRQTGYGKVVMLENPPPYSTVYAHLSRFAKGLRNGATVARGQVIGYVGRTGWATGPHLHYEVHVDDVAMDPLTVDLPGDDRLRGEERQRFAKEAESLSAELSG